MTDNTVTDMSMKFDQDWFIINQDIWDRFF